MTANDATGEMGTASAPGGPSAVTPRGNNNGSASISMAGSSSNQVLFFFESCIVRG